MDIWTMVVEAPTTKSKTMKLQTDELSNDFAIVGTGQNDTAPFIVMRCGYNYYINYVDRLYTMEELGWDLK